MPNLRETLNLPVDSNEYLNRSGGFCPKCRADIEDITYDFERLYFELGLICVPIKCNICDNEWEEDFTLHGYTEKN